jgi:hemolysin activation/secretion protein
MPSTENRRAGSIDRTDKGSISVLNIDTSMTNVTRAIILALALGLHHGSLYAQPAGPGSAGDTPSGGTSRPGDFLPTLPQLDAPPDATIEVPEKVVPEEKKTPYGARVFIKEIHLTGNTVFSAEDFKDIITPYTNRIVSSSELEDLRVELTRYYIERGYLNSGAVLPDQKVVDGIVQMTIIEGRLTDIEVKGNKHLSSSYIKDRLELGAGPPLNVNDLQEQIQIILESPVVDTINSALRPGDRPGEAGITAQVKEGPRFLFTPVIDNRLSPSLGDVRVVLPIYVSDLTGYGDTLNGGVGLSEGLADGYLNWSVPLNAYDTTLSLIYDKSDSEVVNGAFTVLDIESETQTYGFRLSHPFYRSPTQKFTMALGMDVRTSETMLLGQGFAFTPGVPVDGIVDLSIIRFSQDWSNRGLNSVLAARSMFSFGIDANDATINTGDIPSGEFFAWLGQFQWASLFGENLGQLIFRANVQLTNDPLFSMEQFSVGGALSVRGYRENQIVRDNGYDVSLEYRYPIMKDATGRSVLALAPFIDAGGGSNNEMPNGPNPSDIASAGIGIRWDPTVKVHAEVYWGHAFDDVFVGDYDSIQDDGIHFLISANLLEWF